MALADVTLSAADIAVLVLEDQLTEDFLNTYNRIMLGISIAAAPFLLVGFFKMGLQLLKTASQSSKEFIRTCMLKVLLEKNIINFEKQATFLLADEIAFSSGNKLVFQRLQDQGVVYLKGIRQGDKTEKLFAIYDDVVLAEINNTPEGITKFAGQYRKLKGQELVEKLVEFGGVSKKLQSIWKVNLKEGRLNCANCAIAVDYTLSGKPTSALPWTYETIFRNGKKINKISYTRGTNFKILEKEFDNIFIKNITLNDLRKKLKDGERDYICI